MRQAPQPEMKYAGGKVESPGIELDLRGTRVEESLERTEKYLDNAYMARLPWVRIIHGKGTGALRDAIRDSLKGHPFVGEFRAGGPGARPRSAPRRPDVRSSRR